MAWFYNIIMKTFYYRHNKINETPHQIATGKILFNELTFVLKGRLNYTINENTHVLNANDCIFVRSGSIRQRSSTGDCDYVSFNFKSNPPFELPMIIKDAVISEIKLLISVCDEIISKYYSWNDKLDNIVTLIFRLLKDKLDSSEENPIIIKIKRYIQENLSDKLCLSDLANIVGYSPNYCDTLFKKETGRSIVDYLIEERIAEAKRLLAEGILHLKEIAEAVGFVDYNYFSRTFKKKSGYSPTQYKSIRLK